MMDPEVAFFLLLIGAMPVIFIDMVYGYLIAKPVKNVEESPFLSGFSPTVSVLLLPLFMAVTYTIYVIYFATPPIISVIIVSAIIVISYRKWNRFFVSYAHFIVVTLPSATLVLCFFDVLGWDPSIMINNVILSMPLAVGTTVAFARSSPFITHRSLSLCNKALTSVIIIAIISSASAMKEIYTDTGVTISGFTDIRIYEGTSKQVNLHIPNIYTNDNYNDQHMFSPTANFLNIRYCLPVYDSIVFEPHANGQKLDRTPHCSSKEPTSHLKLKLRDIPTEESILGVGFRVVTIDDPQISSATTGLFRVISSTAIYDSDVKVYVTDASASRFVLICSSELGCTRLPTDIDPIPYIRVFPIKDLIKWQEQDHAADIFLRSLQGP